MYKFLSDNRNCWKMVMRIRSGHILW